MIRQGFKLLRKDHATSRVVIRGFAAQRRSFLDVQVQDKTRIATLTMQKLPVNSLDLDFLTQMSQALDDLESSTPQGVILTSASPTVFSAGLDFTELYKPTRERLGAFLTVFHDVWLKLNKLSCPTVAVINGHAPAGGCMLALGCEYRIMLPNLKIGLNEAAVGIAAPGWLQESLASVISRRQAEVALTSAKLFSTDEALQVGLVDEAAADKPDAVARAEKFISRFNKISPVARDLTKKVFRGKLLDILEAERTKEMERFRAEIMSPDAQRSIGVFLDSLKKKKE